MKLTNNEIRDIDKHLEAGTPLPDKYRFLLFEDKREVELVWNGKTGEVCNVVLPFQTIEHVDEPRAEKPLGSRIASVAVGGSTIEPKIHTHRSADENERWPGSGTSSLQPRELQTQSLRRFGRVASTCGLRDLDCWFYCPIQLV